MIVIKMLGSGISTYGAGIALSSPQLVNVFSRQTVATDPVSVLAEPVMARLASSTETTGRGSVPDVVLDRHRSLAAGAPPEAVRNPREVLDFSTLRRSPLPVVRVARSPVAFETVEGHSVAEGTVLTERSRWLRFAARRAALLIAQCDFSVTKSDH
jgi:hypothetical protein